MLNSNVLVSVNRILEVNLVKMAALSIVIIFTHVQMKYT